MTSRIEIRGFCIVLPNERHQTSEEDRKQMAEKLMKAVVLRALLSGYKSNKINWLQISPKSLS
jgi:hypothetical protein